MLFRGILRQWRVPQAVLPSSSVLPARWLVEACLVQPKHETSLTAGFEMGIKDMKVGGQRRIIVPPELGPPTGPSTFFSAKQCEVFDVELQQVKSCQRKQAGMFSTVTCQ